jgi:hypothetical protein
LSVVNDNLAPPIGKGRLGGVKIYAKIIEMLGFILQPSLHI